MLSRISTTLFLVGAVLVAGAQAQSKDQVLQAYRTGIKKHSDFKTLHKFVIGDTGQQKWNRIEWYTNLVEAREAAKTQKRPLFIWAMNGDPLGCV